MGQWITLDAKGHKFPAYRADPSGKPKGGIVVIQEIFGVNNHIRNVADRLAKAGYVAVAPAIFDRIQKGVELGYDQAGMQTGVGLMQKLDMNHVIDECQAAVNEAKSAGKVGITGFCYGGTVAFVGAARLDGLAAAVGYYGGAIAKFTGEKPRVPLMLHFGEQDTGIPMSDVEAIRKARPEAVVYTYPGAGHGFNCDERGSYNADSAALAWDRTLKFFGQHVG